jgi:hypothetical protein
VSGYLIGSQAAGEEPLPPRAELAWWYQFYFATERGRAGYDRYRREFSRLIWQLASPKWAFDDATFARSAAAFDNPDHAPSPGRVICGGAPAPACGPRAWIPGPGGPGRSPEWPAWSPRFC